MELTEKQKAAVRRLRKEHLTPATYKAIIKSEAYELGLWRELAQCYILCKEYPKDYSPNDWFPDDHKAALLHPPRKIKAICEECPVRLPCLVFAVHTKQESGIFGGRTMRDIRRIRRRLFEALNAKD